MKIENVEKCISIDALKNRLGVSEDIILSSVLLDNATPEMIIANYISECCEHGDTTSIYAAILSYRQLLSLYWGENQDKIIDVLQDMETDGELTKEGICEAITSGKVFSLI